MLRIITTLLCAACFAVHAQESYVVKAKIENAENYKMHLSYLVNGQFNIDTSYVIENGWAVFRGKVDRPVIANLGVRQHPALMIKTVQYFIPGPNLSFALTNETITIRGSADRVYMAKVKGGIANKEWATIKSKQNKLAHQGWMAQKKAYENHKPGADSAAFDRASEIRLANAERNAKLQRDFIAKNPGSLVSMYFLSGMVNSLPLDDLKSGFAKLGDTHKDSDYARSIAEKIQSMEATAIGKKAIGIDKKDIHGNPVDLETLKGRYVLLDFWGSWCGPCRASHPHLKALYAKYKADGFEILGIAQEQRRTLEENRKVWVEAIEQDGIDWLQVLNNEDIAKFDAVKAYGVTAFPTKILLDKEGKIIARYVGGEKELDAKLQEIFGK